MAGKNNKHVPLSVLERSIRKFERRLAQAEQDAMDLHQDICANLHRTASRIDDILVSEDAGHVGLVTDIKEVATESGSISLQYITDISGASGLSPAARYEVRDVLKEHELAIENYAAKMVRKSTECRENYVRLLELTSIERVFSPICEAGTAIIYACYPSQDRMKRIEADLSDGGIISEDFSPIERKACFDSSANATLSMEGRKNCADVYLVYNLSSRISGDDAVEYALQSIMKPRLQDTLSKKDMGKANEMIYYVAAAIPFMCKKPEGLQ